MLSLELQQEVCGKPDTIYSPLSSIYITHKLTGRPGTPWLTVLQSPCLPDRVKTEDVPQTSRFIPVQLGSWVQEAQLTDKVRARDIKKKDQHFLVFLVTLKVLPRHKN